MAELKNKDKKKTLSLSQNSNNTKKNNNKPKKNSLSLTPSALDRHPSALHLGEQKEEESPNVNLHSFNGVNVILANPKINDTDNNPYTFSTDQVNEKVFDSSDTFYMKNINTNIQFTPSKKKEPSTLSVKHKSLSSFTNNQKKLDVILTECIQNGNGYDKVEEAFSLFHTFKKD